MPRKLSYADLEAAYKASDKERMILTHVVQDAMNNTFDFSCTVKESDHSPYADADQVYQYTFGRLESASGGYVLITYINAITHVKFYEDMTNECHGRFNFQIDKREAA